jgi:hypothetical protein
MVRPAREWRMSTACGMNCTFASIALRLTATRTLSTLR